MCLNVSLKPTLRRSFCKDVGLAVYFLSHVEPISLPGLILSPLDPAVSHLITTPLFYIAVYNRLYTQNAYIMHYYLDCIYSHQVTNTSIQRKGWNIYKNHVSAHTHADDNLLWRSPLSEDEKPSRDLTAAHSAYFRKLFIFLLFSRKLFFSFSFFICQVAVARPQ